VEWGCASGGLRRHVVGVTESKIILIIFKVFKLEAISARRSPTLGRGFLPLPK